MHRGCRDTPRLCLAVFALGWLILAIAPRDRATWLLENLPTAIAVVLALVTFRRFRFSDRAYVQATVFLLFHTLGSHYSYAATPIGDWIRDAFGLTRNHYDRFVHVLFGALMLAPTRELFFCPPARVPPRRQSALSIALIAAWSAGYEILEWLTAILVDPAAGTAFLGTQGDPWDAQKDMLCAVAGAAVAALAERAARERDAAGFASRLHGLRRAASVFAALDARAPPIGLERSLLAPIRKSETADAKGSRHENFDSKPRADVAGPGGPVHD